MLGDLSGTCVCSDFLIAKWMTLAFFILLCNICVFAAIIFMMSRRLPIEPCGAGQFSHTDNFSQPAALTIGLVFIALY